MKCKHCGEKLTRSSHYCEETGLLYSASEVAEKESSGDFTTSLIIGAVTDSALLGGLLGGDIIGGVIGDSLDGDLFD